MRSVAMRSESLINNMMQPSPFSEFNPLDVLATAASLQSARIETDDELNNHNNNNNGSSADATSVAAEAEGDEDKDGDLNDSKDVSVPVVSSVKPVESNVSSGVHVSSTVGCTTVVENTLNTVTVPCHKDNVVSHISIVNCSDSHSVKSPTDDSVFQVPAVKHVKINGVKNNNGAAVNTHSNVSKPVTVLRACKPQMTDHSYAFMFQLQSLKTDEDEGYSSRSSIDEEGEDISGSHGINLDSPDGLRSPTTPKPTAKMPRIIILSKDSNHVTTVNASAEQLTSPKRVQIVTKIETPKIEPQPHGPCTNVVENVEITPTTSSTSSSIQNVVENVVQDTAEYNTAMPEEHINEVISLDPASVVDSLSLPSPEVVDVSDDVMDDVADDITEGGSAIVTERQIEVDILDEDAQDVPESMDTVVATDSTITSQIVPSTSTVETLAESEKLSVKIATDSDDTDTSDETTTDASPEEVHIESDVKADTIIESVESTTESVTESTDASILSNAGDSIETKVDVVSENVPKADPTAESSRNQYIIEDDVSPVSKFGSADVETSKEIVNIALPTDRGDGTLLVVSKPDSKNRQILKPTQSLLKTSNIVSKTNSSVVRVIPFVNGGRVTQILPRPVQCVTPVKVQSKTIMKVASPCVEVKKPPTLGKLLMPVATTTLSSTKGIILKSPVPSPTAALSSPAASTDTTSLSGRSTPKSIPDTDSVDSDVSPTLKVTMLSNDTDLQDKEKVKVEKTSIGTVGSLSWKSFGGGLIQLGANARSKEFIRIQGSQIEPREPSEEEASKDDDLSVSLSPNPWAGTSLETASMDDVLSVTNSDDSMLSEPPVMSPVVTSPTHSKRRSKLDKIDPDTRWEHCSELHPLIDHDYCMFTDFNAQIQSSIIATTESKTRIDRRYNKKTKLARTKSAASMLYEADRPLRGRPSEKVLKGKKGRLKKKELMAARVAAAYDDDMSSVDMKPAVHSKESEEKVLKRQRRQEKKMLAEKKKAERNDRNFVKITGSYKDEFVYYATRNYRGRPRKAPEPYLDPLAKPLKPIPAGGVNDFDWYRDLSRADKTSYFGSHGISGESSQHASPAALPLPPPPSEDALMCKQDSIPGSTPIHESDVVDLVCELSGFGGESYTASTSGGVEVSTTEETEQPSTNGDSSLDLNQMAEHVCSMLTSMDENELRMLGSSLEKLGEDGDEKPSGSGLNDASFDGFLGAPVQGQAELGDDLDEINDNDLLTTDISNMNDMSDILTDLRSSATAQTTTTVDGANVQAGSSTVTATATTPSSFTTDKLDRAELFPDIHGPALQNRTESSMVPELTVVSMFWNDLPGLMISGVQHVRLVDIHKQVLPAKDTGILKKRCQMLGLEIANCSELQRDFLIRYANAAKSKSTVIVSKKSAQDLIGFYVNPKPRGSRQTAEEKEEAKQNVADVSSPPVPEASTEGTTVNESGSLDQQPATPTPSRNAETEEAVPQSRSGKKSRKRKLTGDSEINPGSPGPLLNVATLATPPSTSTASSVTSTTPATTSSQDVKRSERLRHKKVRYADMANGTAYLEGEDDEDGKVPESPESNTTTPSLPSSPSLETDDSGLSSDHENRDITLQKLVYPEELEIKKIRLKARKKKLTKQEKRRLKRLKERMQKKAMKQKMEKKRLRLLQRQKTVGGKGKRRLQETHAYTKKVNPEHCYAACPASKDDVDVTQVDKEIEVKDMTVKEEPKAEPKAPLAVIHRDNVHRQGPGTARVGRWQDGEVYLQLYRNKDSACIQCVTCRDFYTVRRFLKHMHKHNNPDELLEVNLPQKFELRNPSPTDGETQDWQEFQTKRRLVEVSPNERGRKALNKPAESSPKTNATQSQQSSDKDSQSSGTNTTKKSSEETTQQAAKAVVQQAVKTETTPTTLTETIKQETPDKDSTVTPEKSEQVTEKLVEKSVAKTAEKTSEKEVKVEIHLKSDVESKVVSSSSKADFSPEENGLTRHSTRVRKRKQLHPIESYVYSKLLPTNGKPEMREDLPGEIDKVSMSVSPVRATKFKVSVRKDGSSQVTRLDVKVPGGSEKRLAKRSRYSQ